MRGDAGLLRGCKGLSTQKSRCAGKGTENSTRETVQETSYTLGMWHVRGMQKLGGGGGSVGVIRDCATIWKMRDGSGGRETRNSGNT